MENDCQQSQYNIKSSWITFVVNDSGAVNVATAIDAVVTRVFAVMLSV